MSSDPLHERGRALEDRFFKEVDEKLLARMRADARQQAARKSLSTATGIQEAWVLDALIDCGLSESSVVALGLVPLVMVAWADGDVQPAERTALLKASEEQGIDRGTPAYELFDHWLARRPTRDLFDAWKGYFQALHGRLDEGVKAGVRAGVVERARRIARAAGGLLGLGTRISPEEERVLDEIERLF